MRLNMGGAFCFQILLISAFLMFSEGLSDGEVYCTKLTDELSRKIDSSQTKETHLTITPQRLILTKLGGSARLTCAGNKVGLYFLSLERNGTEIYDRYRIKPGYENQYRVECSFDEHEVIVQHIIMDNVAYEHAGEYQCIADGFKSAEIARAEVVVLDKELKCSSNIDAGPLIAGPVCGLNLEPATLVIICSINYAGNIAPVINFEFDGKQFHAGSISYSRRMSGTTPMYVYTMKVATDTKMDGLKFSAHASVEGADNSTTHSQVVPWHSSPVHIAYFHEPTSTERDVPINRLDDLTCPVTTTNLPIETQWQDDGGKIDIRNMKNVQLGQKFRCFARCLIPGGNSSELQYIQTITVTERESNAGMVGGIIVGLLVVVFIAIVVIGGVCYFNKWKKQGVIKVGGAVTGIAELKGRIYIICVKSNVMRVFNVNDLAQHEDIVLKFIDPIPIGDLASCPRFNCLYLYESADNSPKFIWRLTKQPGSSALFDSSSATNGSNAIPLQNRPLSGHMEAVIDGVMSCQMSVVAVRGNNCVQGNICLSDVDGFNYECEAYLFTSEDKSETWLAVKWVNTMRVVHEDTISVSRLGQVLLSRDNLPCVDIYNFDGSLANKIMLPTHVTEMQHAIQTPSGSLIVSHGWNNNSHRVLELSGDGQNINWSLGGSKGKRADQFNCPDHVAIGEDGNIYVADCDNHRVLKFSQDSRAKEDRAGLLPGWKSSILVKKSRNDFPSRLTTVSLEEGWFCLMIGWWSGEIQRIYLRSDVNQKYAARLRVSYHWRNGGYYQ